MKTYTILLGGELAPSTRLIDTIQGTNVIAADSGIRHALTLSVTPDLWVGDFDSSDQDLFRQYEHIERKSFDSDKDMTDGEIAIQYALEFGAERVILVGAFGGTRMEHEFCHLTQAIRLGCTGKQVELLDGNKEAHPLMLHKSIDLHFPIGTSFSILAFSDLEGLSIEGAKWPLENANVSFGSSLTLSNEAAGPLSVTLRSGRAILLAQL